MRQTFFPSEAREPYDLNGEGMGKCYIKYKGFGFWSGDSFIESWLLTLVGEMEKLPNAEPWQEALMQHWRTQAAIDAGLVRVGLDNFLDNDSKKEAILSVAKYALPHAEALGRETGELFIKLLERRLRTNESSPIDYLHWPDESRKG